MNDDLIRRSDAINVIKRNHYRLQGMPLTYSLLIEQMKLVPRSEGLLYVCDRKRCENCHPECELTSDINHAARKDRAIVFDKSVMPKQGEWTPCSERLPNENEWVLCSCNNGLAILILKLKGKVWHKTESVEYLSKFVNAWMPLPEPYIVEQTEPQTDYRQGYIDAVQHIADELVRQNLHIAPNEPQTERRDE